MPDMADRRPGAEVARPRRQLVMQFGRDLLEGPHKAIGARLELPPEPGCQMRHCKPPFSWTKDEGRTTKDGPLSSLVLRPSSELQHIRLDHRLRHVQRNAKG